MLKHLTITHYALIDHLEIDWPEGFTVITGETGAGKSIMLGALGLLLGGRADAKAIRAGEKKCVVEAVFSLEGLDVGDLFARHDMDDEAEGGECIVRREILASGKSRAFVNDTPVPAAFLKELGSHLIDIHSQHQNLLIRNERFLIDTLDLTAGDAPLLTSYQSAYHALADARNRLKKLREAADEGAKTKDYLQYRLERLDGAQLKEGEQEELEDEQRVLSHAEEIKEALYTASGCLDGEETGVSNLLRRAEEALRSIADHFPDADGLAERLASCRIEADDVASEVSRRAEEIGYDPARLQYVEERLSTIYDLEQSFHLETVTALIAHAEELRQQLDAIETSDDDIARLEAEVERLSEVCRKEASKLTEARTGAARAMEGELTERLALLGMEHVNLQVSLTPRERPDEWGADQVVLLFSANQGVPPRDVSAIASGGEIARLMLALKAYIARRRQLPTIVFDEIDTGVSGNMAERMAKMMRQIADDCQVICITHLPQIAALGANHYRVYKDDTAATTLSHIDRLSPDERVTELAHMLSGTQLTAAAIDNAKALLAAGADVS